MAEEHVPATLIADPMSDRLKNFKQEAEDGLPKAEALVSEIDTATETVERAYAAALVDLGSAWKSSDGAGTIANLTLITEAVSRLKTSASSDISNIVADVKKIQEKIKLIEDEYKKAQSYKPGKMIEREGGIAGGAGKREWQENDNSKIIKANEDLPEMVKETEGMIDAVIESTAAVKLGIIGNMTAGGSLGTYTGYSTEFTENAGTVHHPNVFTSILSGLIGMVESILGKGEGAVDGLVTGVTSLLQILGLDDVPIVGGILEAVQNFAGDDLITGLIDPLLESWDGYDASAREFGRTLGDVGGIYACAMLGPVGSIIYGLSEFGKAVNEQKANGGEIDGVFLAKSAGEALVKGISIGSPIGRIFNVLFNTDVASDVISLLKEKTGIDLSFLTGIADWASNGLDTILWGPAKEIDISNTMECPNCHNKVAKAAFCSSCGNALVAPTT